MNSPKLEIGSASIWKDKRPLALISPLIFILITFLAYFTLTELHSKEMKFID